jgi:phosphinothricin acetyltransferase
MPPENRPRNVQIDLESPRCSDARALLRAAVLELIARYNEEDDGQESFAPEEVEQTGAAFWVARLNGVPVGCVALRPAPTGYYAGPERAGEIKRMFVQAEARGHGVGRALLSTVEQWARENGYKVIILETGTAQPEAMGMYARMGYAPYPNYGEYAEDSRSRCYTKSLEQNGQIAPSFTVRPIQASDAEGIRAIYNWAVHHTTATMDTQNRTPEGQRSWMGLHGPHTRYPVYVAECAPGQIIGYASLSPYIPRDGYRNTAETSVYVHPDWHGQGIATALLSRLITQADQLGYVSLLALITSDNTPSLRLHQRFGFEQAGHLRRVGHKLSRDIDVTILQRLWEGHHPPA